MKRLALIFVTLAVLTAACGSDGSSSGGSSDGLNADEQALADAMSEATMEGQEVPLTQDEATCWSEAIVADFGVDDLSDMGITAENADAGAVEVDADTGESFVDSLANCTDLKELFRNEVSAGVTEGPEADAANCVVDALTEQDIKDIIAIGFAADEDAAGSELEAKLEPVFTECAPS